MNDERSVDGLTPAQNSICFMEQACPGSPAYNLHLSLRLRGDLDLAALEQALAAIVWRHDALQTRIVGDAVGGPIALVGDGPAMTLGLVDVAGDTLGARELECARFASLTPARRST